ncbi:MAG: TIGR04053 family radical SAM/SPASM domain-containing protein [Dehalococcoidia bacterium]
MVAVDRTPGAHPATHPATGDRPKPELMSVDFNERPFTVAWEITRACALACVHCRAEAQPRAHPWELTTAEAFRLIDDIAELNPPVLVLTGGDPLMRRDLYSIVERAVDRGLRVSVSPTTTALATRARLERLRDLGIQMVHVSVDGADAATHDTFRGVEGTFARVMSTLDILRDLGVGVQVGSTVARHNVHQLPAMAELMASKGIRVWNVFYLVPTGRARLEQMITPEEAEESWRWLVELGRTAPFTVRTTAAPQFRRTMMMAVDRRGGEMRLTGAGYQIREAPSGVETRGVNDGKGFAFIDHLGNVCPSGFLQISAGNVRNRSLKEIYRDSPLFKSLRDPSALSGQCGRCRYAELCGGSRARAYGVTGSYLGDDPLCTLDAEARERTDQGGAR